MKSVVRSKRWLLLVASVVGAVWAVRAGFEQRALRAEVARLHRTIGVLPIDNPKKAMVVAVPTGGREDPLHLAWRIHVPAGVGLMWCSEYSQGSFSSGGHADSEPRDGLLRVRIRKNESTGQFELFTAYFHGSSHGNLGFQDLEKHLTDPARQLVVRQLGRDGPAELDPNQVTTLLSIEFSESVRAEFGKHFPRVNLDKPLLQFRAGSSQAFAKLNP